MIVNVNEIMGNASKRESFLKSAEAFRNLFNSPGWKEYIRYTEDLLESRRNDIENIDPDKPGAIGKKQGTILALKQALCFEETIENAVKTIRASADPLEEK